MFTAQPRNRAAAEPLFTPRFAGLWLFAFITFFSAFQLLPAIPFRILELGGSTAAAGSFLSVYTFASAFAAPVMGSIADHVGRKRMLVTASLLFIVFSVAYGLVRQLPLLLVIGAIHGAIWSGILASSSAIMSEFIPVSRRTEGMAYWGLASMTAVAIAPAVGLWVFHYGWLTLCLELSALSAVMAVWASRLPAKEAELPEVLPRLDTLFDWGVVKTTLSLTTVSFGYGGVTSYAAIVAVQRGIEPRWLYFAVFATTIIVIRIATSHLGDRFGYTVILYPALVAIPVAFALLAWAQTRTEFVISAVIFGAGFGSAYPAFAAFILGATDPSRRARTFGSIVWAFDAGIGSGSLLVGVMGERYGLANAFLVAAGLSCLAVPIFAWSSRGLTRGTAVARTPEHG
jgi:MFS family permease